MPKSSDGSETRRTRQDSTEGNIRIDCKINGHDNDQSGYSQAESKDTDAKDHNCLDHALGQQHVGVDDPHRQKEEDEVNDNADGRMELHHAVVGRWLFASKPRSGGLEEIACER